MDHYMWYLAGARESDYNFLYRGSYSLDQYATPYGDGFCDGCGGFYGYAADVLNENGSGDYIHY